MCGACISDLPFGKVSIQQMVVSQRQKLLKLDKIMITTACWSKGILQTSELVDDDLLAILETSVSPLCGALVAAGDILVHKKIALKI